MATFRRNGVPQDTSGAVAIIDKDHWDIHKGIMWQVSESRASIDDSPGALYLISTGKNELHFSVGATISGQECVIEIFETPITSAAGVAVTPVNKNRSRVKRSLVRPLVSVISYGPTVTGTGTLLGISHAPATTGGGGGATIDQSYQYVFATNSVYLLRVRSEAGTGTAYINMAFYEVAI